MDETTGGRLAMSSSAPTLPPVNGTSRVPAAVLAAQTRANRAQRETANRRQQFLSGLINEDLQKLTSWHGTRPHHEQKHFLRSVDSLYKAFDSMDGSTSKTQVRPTDAERSAAHQAAQEAAVRAAAAAHAAAEDDPLAGPPRTPRSANLHASSSEPCLMVQQPIEVFEQKKRRELRRQRDPTAEDPNSLEDWLEGCSITTQTTASSATSRRTRFSELTMTSLGGSSICSEPGTMHQSQFRHHRRAFALNKNHWTPMNQHEAGYLKDGIPHMGWPNSERLVTTFKDQFGSRAIERKIGDKTFSNVLKEDQHQFISRFLETAPPEQRDQFAGMVRSLQYLRKAADREKESITTEAYNLQENSRLWKPPRQRPMFDNSERNLSRVPLGSMTQTTKKAVSQLHIPYIPQCPPSPTVSGLGSLPLTRVSTPLVISDAC